MTNTNIQSVTWLNNDSDILEDAVRGYIEKFGLLAFMEEYYNLLGTRPRAEFTAKNYALANALGLDVSVEALPLTLPRNEVLPLIYWPKLILDRKFLARLFADPAYMPWLSELQRLFLEWHFLAPRNYSWSLVKKRSVLLGWNDVAELFGPDDFAMYTDLVGCTGLFALAPDGSVQMSHYDDDNLNPAQVTALIDFLRRYPGSQIYLVGVHAEKLAQLLAKTRGLSKINIHIKRIYIETGYWVGFRRQSGEFQAVYSETPLAADYIPSAHNNEYGQWFIYGRFSELYPRPEVEFRDIPFETFRG